MAAEEQKETRSVEVDAPHKTNVEGSQSLSSACQKEIAKQTHLLAKTKALRVKIENRLNNLKRSQLWRIKAHIKGILDAQILSKLNELESAVETRLVCLKTNPTSITQEDKYNFHFLKEIREEYDAFSRDIHLADRFLHLTLTIGNLSPPNHLTQRATEICVAALQIAPALTTAPHFQINNCYRNMPNDYSLVFIENIYPAQVFSGREMCDGYIQIKAMGINGGKHAYILSDSQQAELAKIFEDTELMRIDRTGKPYFSRSIPDLATDEHCKQCYEALLAFYNKIMKQFYEAEINQWRIDRLEQWEKEYLLIGGVMWQEIIGAGNENSKTNEEKNGKEEIARTQLLAMSRKITQQTCLLESIEGRRYRINHVKINWFQLLPQAVKRVLDENLLQLDQLSLAVQSKLAFASEDSFRADVTADEEKSFRIIGSQLDVLLRDIDNGDILLSDYSWMALEEHEKEWGSYYSLENFSRTAIEIFLTALQNDSVETFFYFNIITGAECEQTRYGFNYEFIQIEFRYQKRGSFAYKLNGEQQLELAEICKNTGLIQIDHAGISKFNDKRQLALIGVNKYTRFIRASKQYFAQAVFNFSLKNQCQQWYEPLRKFFNTVAKSEINPWKRERLLGIFQLAGKKRWFDIQQQILQPLFNSYLDDSRKEEWCECLLKKAQDLKPESRLSLGEHLNSHNSPAFRLMGLDILLELANLPEKEGDIARQHLERILCLDWISDEFSDVKSFWEKVSKPLNTYQMELKKEAALELDTPLSSDQVSEEKFGPPTPQSVPFNHAAIPTASSAVVIDGDVERTLALLNQIVLEGDGASSSSSSSTVVLSSPRRNSVFVEQGNQLSATAIGQVHSTTKCNFKPKNQPTDV